MYSAAAMERHAGLRESMREMESRKQRRLEVLVERTTALLGRLQRDIDALVGGGGAGGGGGVEIAAEATPATSSIRPQRLREVTPRDYHERSVSWMLSLHAHGLNRILADEVRFLRLVNWEPVRGGKDVTPYFTPHLMVTFESTNHFTDGPG